MCHYIATFNLRYSLTPSHFVSTMCKMYHDLGDTIALQYGGSHLVNRLDDYDIKIKAWSSHSRNMIEGLKRYYANSLIGGANKLFAAYRATLTSHLPLLAPICR